MKRIALRQTLDRCDLSAIQGDGQRQAGVDATPVDQNRAGTALATVTAFLVPVICRRSRNKSSSVTRGSSRTIVLGAPFMVRLMESDMRTPFRRVMMRLMPPDVAAQIFRLARRPDKRRD